MVVRNAAATSWIAPETVGIATLTLSVTDPHGATVSFSLAINVAESAPAGDAAIDLSFNHYPVVSGITTSAARVNVGQATSFSALASDLDGDPLSYQWLASCSGRLPMQELTFELVAADPEDTTLSFSWSASAGTLGPAQDSANSSRISYSLERANQHLTEIFDPTTGSWTPAGSLAEPRHGHTATLLPSGQVLIVGGFGGGTLATAELYTP